MYVGASREGIGFGMGTEPMALAGSGVPFDFHSPKPRYHTQRQKTNILNIGERQADIPPFATNQSKALMGPLGWRGGDDILRCIRPCLSWLKC